MNFTGYTVLNGANTIDIFSGTATGSFSAVSLSAVESSLVSYLGSNYTLDTGSFEFSNGQLTFNATAIPEPSTFVLLGAGILLLISLRSRREKTKKV